MFFFLYHIKLTPALDPNVCGGPKNIMETMTGGNLNGDYDWIKGTLMERKRVLGIGSSKGDDKRLRMGRACISYVLQGPTT